MKRAQRHRGGRISASGGVPLEQAPWWVLTMTAVLLALMFFPAVVGLVALGGAYHGQWRLLAAVALAIATALIVGLATLKPWSRRPSPEGSAWGIDERPFLARFSTWLIVTLALPNILFGCVVLTSDGPVPSPQVAYGLALLVAMIQGAFALAARWRSRKAPTNEAD